MDKRDSEDESVTRRRRECLLCKKRFTTYERVEVLSVQVIKKDGSLQSYDREKLSRGILIAGQKRIPAEELEKMIDDIEMHILSRKASKIAASDIGRMVLTRLKRMDKVAYMRFASVFLEFQDIEEFKHELEKIEEK